MLIPTSLENPYGKQRLSTAAGNKGTSAPPPGSTLHLTKETSLQSCLIYAMISFLGVVVLCKVYTGVYLQRKHRKADLGAIDDNLHHQKKEKSEKEEIV